MFAVLNFMGLNCEKIIKIMEFDFHQVYNIVQENYNTFCLLIFWLFCVFICLYYFKSFKILLILLSTLPFIPERFVFIEIYFIYAIIPYVYNEYKITALCDNKKPFQHWTQLQAIRGDIIEFKRCTFFRSYGYLHWGIYVGEDNGVKKIIHFVNLKKGNGKFRYQSLEHVANGNKCRYVQ
jgi:hypothetical protein